MAATSPSGATTFVPITPCRITDTRPAPDTVGPSANPIGAGQTLTISAHGSNGECTGIPNTATALSLNVTAIGATSGTFVTVWPTGGTQPKASSLNPQPGAPPTPNAVVTPISSGGQFNVFNFLGTIDVIVDVNGYYVDHDHDDRYYTKSQVDALVTGDPVENPIVIGPAEFRPAAYFAEINGGVNWAIDPLLTKLGPGGTPCVIAPVELPIGRTVTSVHLTYFSDTGVAVEGSVNENKVSPGGDPTTEYNLVSANFPSTPVGGYVNGTMSVQNPAAARAGYDYSLTLCANDQITITAVSLQLNA